jgi:hypothetical protein
MKTFKLITLLCLLIGGFTTANAQSTTDPDSVCAGATAKSYKVLGTAGSTYQWVVNGGTKASGGTTDSITVNWSSTPGTDTLKVVEFNTIGCPGDTIRLAVVRMPLPTVVLSGTDSICINSATTALKLKMTFTGLGPWTVSFLEDGTTRSVSTSSNPYTFNSQLYSVSGTKGYTINTITGRLGCVGSKSGSAAVTVFPKPSTSAIRHY